ncbi:MAG TPA: hypothetical protein VN031_00310 [Candidatus Microsaccharimonas sp.]|nr:hypothetical protein [Candidatus Microsaccharimonas sp.]
MAKMPAFTRRCLRFIASPLFFALILVLYVLQAGWIALTARYPQPFDEQFHVGLIQLHAQQWWPLITSQPPGTAALGAYLRDPSFLYHYLMSFPYRFIELFTHDLTIQVLWLRAINIGLFVGFLMLVRQVLRRFSSASDGLINLSLFFFTLIPVVPMLGAEVNYDNLFICMVALALWWCLRLRESKTWNLRIILELLLICIFASMVKYAFLPIAMAITGYVIYLGFKRRQLRIWSQLRQITRPWLVFYVVLLIVGGGLFTERYAVNIVKYHTPIPECDQVLTIDDCQSYGPWARNYMLANMHETLTHHQVLFYPYQWLCRMMQEMTFTISSGFNTDGSVTYWQADSLPVIKDISWAVLTIGVGLLVFYGRRLAREPVLRLTLLLAGIYVLVLYVQNYNDYLHTTRVVAVHGRYLVAFVPVLFLAIAQALREFLRSRAVRRIASTEVKLAVLGVAMLVLITQGGGVETFILRSQARWFWPQSQPAQRINADAQSLLKPLAIGE